MLPWSLDLKNFPKSAEFSTIPSKEQIHLQPARKLLTLKPSLVLNAAYSLLQRFFFFPEEYIAYFKAGGLQERFRTRKVIVAPCVLLAFCKLHRDQNPMIILLSFANIKPFS